VSGKGLVARGVTKAFSATKALAGVDLEAPAGAITAVIGQNGAGKSTLMGILAGVIAPDAGTLELDGVKYAPRSPRDAKLAGVAMVHQELSLCPHLSVSENVLLGALPTRRGLVDWTRAHAMTREVLEPLAGKDAIDPRAKVQALSIANQQLVEIARALADATCRVLILDEPTSSLGAHDTERLFSRLRELRDRGLVVLYLSHFLEEVKAIADRFVVVRDGRSVGEGLAAEASIDAMVELMAGRRVEALYARSAREPKDVVLSVEGVGAKLELRRGEVVGIAGLLGAGRTELLRSIFGLDAPRGTVRVKGETGARSPAARLAAGVAMASEDRKGEGLATSLSVAANVTLARPQKFFVTAKGDQRATTPWIERLQIRAKPDQRASELSGGNQQKVALARILHHGADVLLVDEPTRGIDVEAKAQIYALIDRAALEGKAVLLVSSYLPELLGVCDRIHVMRRGVLGESHDAKDVDEHALLREAVA
jgi:ribose transport system ATP-binding protein